MANVYSKLADFIQKYPKHIVILWIVLLLVSLPVGVHTLTDDDVLSYDLTGMVDDSYESIQGLYILSDSNYFPAGAGTDVVVVIEANNSMVNDIKHFTNDFDYRLKSTYGHDNVEAKYLQLLIKEGADSGAAIVSVVFNPEYTVSLDKEIDTIRSLVSQSNSYNFTTYVTGSSAIGHDTEVGAMEDIKKIDPFTILLVLVLIGLFFRSLTSAATPPMVIGFAYGIVLTVIFAIAQVMDVYYISSTIVLVAMLGAGCDYCIFILARYREERKAGLDHHAALKESVTWAGESITTSGISVIIGFGAMALCSFSMIGTMGLILASGIVFALLAALTLIPAIIAIVGDKIFCPTTIEKLDSESSIMKGWYGKISKKGEHYFIGSAKHAIKYAKPIVLAAILVTLPLGYVALTNQGSYDIIGTMPNSESKDGVDVLTSTGYGGTIMPTYVLLKTDASGGELYNIATITPEMIVEHTDLAFFMDMDYQVWTERGMTYVSDLLLLSAGIVANDPNISSASGPFCVFAILKGMEAQGIPFDTAVDVLLDNDIFDSMSDTEKGLMKAVIRSDDVVASQVAMGILDYNVNMAMGTCSSVYDGVQYLKLTVTTVDEPMSSTSLKSIDKLADFMKEYDSSLYTGVMVTGSVAAINDIADIVNSEFRGIEIIVVILIFLLLFFVMKSYITPLRAILTIVMSIIWTLGLTFLVFETVLGVPVSFIMPIILFVICLGLGMDYDILLTTRIKENVLKGMDNDSAISEAIHKSGSVITICGLIMAGAFGTMMVSSSPMLQEMGFALCFAIAVDALIVRTYIVPAVMHLLGRWNWIGPKFLKEKTEMKKVHVFYLGLIAAIVFAVCAIFASEFSSFSIFESGFADAMGFDGISKKLMAVSVIAGGLLAVAFGIVYSKVFTSSSDKSVGALFVLAGAMMLISSVVKIDALHENALWLATFALGILGSWVFAYSQFEKKPATAGFIVMIGVICAVAAVSGIWTYSGAALAAYTIGLLTVAIRR